MANKVDLKYDSFKRMVSNGDTTKLIQFLTKQKIGKIEFISEPWSFDDKLADMPQTYKDKFGGSRVTKWVIDLENNQFIKLVNGDVDVKSRMPVGESIGEIQDLIRNDKSNGYSKVVLFRRTSIPGKTAGKFSNESKKSLDNQKLVESAIRKIVKKVLIENEQKYVRFDSHRSREKAERILGSLPRAKASFRHNGHFYPMDDEQISKLSSIKSGIKVVNKLPGNPDDWMNSR